MKEALVETRNPKAETRMKSEGRNPKAHLIQRLRGLFGFRVSAFFRPSVFGLRTSGLLDVFSLQLLGLYSSPAPSRLPTETP
jgi:hypothetical protein